MSVCLCTHALFVPNALPYFSHTSAWGPLAHPAKPAHLPLPRWSYLHPLLPLLINHPSSVSKPGTYFSGSHLISPVLRRSIYFNWLESPEGEWWEPLQVLRNREGKVLSSVLSSQEGTQQHGDLHLYHLNSCSWKQVISSSPLGSSNYTVKSFL